MMPSTTGLALTEILEVEGYRRCPAPHRQNSRSNGKALHLQNRAVSQQELKKAKLPTPSK